MNIIAFSKRKLSVIAIAILMVIFFTGALSAKETNPIPTPLTGEQTAEIINKMYDKLGPESGQVLVESNVVLTIAGARGHTGFYVNFPEAGDIEKFMGLNEVLKGTPIKIECHKFNDNLLAVCIKNLKGYERISRLTKLEGITPFFADEGWEGLEKWRKRCLENLEKSGKLPSEENRMIVMDGIRYGYPDQAVRDFLDWINTDRKKYTADSDIPYSSLYSCAQPNFIYYPESEDDEGIRSTVALWGKILREFYQTPFCRELETDTEFIKARLEAKKKLDKYIKAKW